MEKCILVTGFEPFGGQKINPSWLCVSALPETLAGVKVIRRLLPVDWKNGPAALRAAIDELQPAAVLCVGQAGGRDAFNIERVAVNLRGGVDNAGENQTDASVAEDGPTAYFSTLPYAEMEKSLKDHTIPVTYSYSAGIYLCNCTMYTALHYAATNQPEMKAGFLHIPFLPEQTTDKPSLPRELMEQGVRLCAETICKNL